MKFFEFRFALFFLLIPAPAQSLEHAVPGGLASNFIDAVVEAGRTTYSEKVVANSARKNSLTAS